MIRLIPYESFSIDTTLTTDEVVRLVSGAIAQPRSWPRTWRKADREFEGSVSSSGFTISRAIRYRNSFLPYLYGKFVQTPHGVRVVVRMMIHPLVIAFSLVWCGFVGGFLLLALLQALSSGRLDQSILIPTSMLFFYCLMVFVGYGTEEEKAEQFLKRLFELHRRCPP